MAELLDLETSFEEIKSLPIASYMVLPIKAEIENFRSKIEKIGFPCWIKLNTSQHKAKINAIEKCNNFEELASIHKKMKKTFSGEKFIVQEDVRGIEIIVGLKQDKTFDKVLLIGTGGSLTEVIKDTSFRVCPVSKEEILKALQELKVFKVIGQKNYPIKKLIQTIKSFSDLDIKEADLNPIIINEKQVLIADARVSI